MRNVASTVPTFAKYVSCFQDNVYQELSHLYKNPTKKCLHLNHLTVLHHVSCIQKRLIWLYDVSRWSHSMMIDPCGPKHVAVVSVIL